MYGDEITLPRRRFSDQPGGECAPRVILPALRRASDLVTGYEIERMMHRIMKLIAFELAFEEQSRLLGRE